jgi:peroxidase
LDGFVSKAGHVAGRLPVPAKDLAATFSRHNLSARDMAAVSGAHTVGFAHCARFTDRGSSWRRALVASARTSPWTWTRPPSTTRSRVPRQPRPRHGPVPLRPGALRRRPAVEEFAKNFFEAAMVKLGRIGVKTAGRHGEIRKDCAVFN